MNWKFDLIRFFIIVFVHRVGIDPPLSNGLCHIRMRMPGTSPMRRSRVGTTAVIVLIGFGYPFDTWGLEVSGLDDVGTATQSQQSQIEAIAPLVADTDAAQPVIETDGLISLGFVDQYMTEEDWVDDWSVADVLTPTGRRLTELESVVYHTTDDFIGEETELGLRFLQRRETLHYGEIEVLVQLSNLDTEFARRNEGSDAVFTIRQTGMPISQEFWLNSTLGHQRSLTDNFLHGSYRYRLPTSPLLGYNAEIHSGKRKFGLSIGRTGNYSGVALQQFDTDGGILAVGSYQQSLGERWSIGGELINLSKSSEVRNHTSFLGATRYDSPSGNTSHELHLLADDDANVGVWADSHHVFSGGPTLRYGAYYLASDLVWTDAPVADDQRGIYIRTDRRGSRYNYSIGYDYFETGLSRDELSRSDNHSVFLNGNYRWKRRSTLGLSIVYFDRTFTSEVSDAQTNWRVSGSLNHQLRSGWGRVELFASELNSEIATNVRDSLGARVGYDWRLPEHLRLSTELTTERESVFADQVDRNQASLLLRRDFSADLSVGLNLSLYRSKSDLFGVSTGVGFSADARWQFLPHWHTNLSLSHNESAVDVSNFGFVPDQAVSQNNSILLRVSYSKASGSSHRTFGNVNGKAGSGRLEGVVFFDTNRDFVQQSNERTARGVVVLLDGRYETRTDSEGRYSFDPVPAGDHRIQILTEDLPLPWGLDDESPQLVMVDPRRPAYLDFTLIEIN